MGRHDYEGKPATRRRGHQVARPAITGFFAENNSSADHLMPNFWITPADATDLAAHRHQARVNYTFVDGHAVRSPLQKIFAPPQMDLWNPALAR